MPTLLALVLLAFVASAGTAQNVVAIRNVSIIDGTGSAPQLNQTVLIRGSRIAAIGPAAQITIPLGAIVVEAQGKFLIPGLWDMHVHFRGSMRGGDSLLKENEAMLPLFLAHGVTGVREMGGDMVETLLRWRSEIERGEKDGPHIATAGLKLDGVKPTWPGSIAVTTREEARAAVRKVKAVGADFVKVYTGLTSETLAAAADEAKRQHLRLTGHAIGDLTMLEISDLGMDIEHAYPVIATASMRDELSVVRPSSGPRISRMSLQAARLAVQQHNADAVKNLITRFVKNGTSLTPTLHTQWMTTVEPDLSDKHRSYLMPRLLDTWADRGGIGPLTIFDPVRRKARQIEERVVGLLHAGGVTILAGSDVGASNPNLYPGFSLHAELVELAEVGIPPAQVIKAATLDAVRWLGREKDVGTITTDKIADLVLLDANPIEDIRNTLKIRAVFTGGRMLDRARLDAMLLPPQ